MANKELIVVVPGLEELVSQNKALNNTLTATNAGLQALTGTVEDLSSRVKGAEKGQQELKQAVNRLSGQSRDTKDELEDLKKRLAKLEGKESKKSKPRKAPARIYTPAVEPKQYKPRVRGLPRAARSPGQSADGRRREQPAEPVHKLSREAAEFVPFSGLGMEGTFRMYDAVTQVKGGARIGPTLAKKLPDKFLAENPHLLARTGSSYCTKRVYKEAVQRFAGKAVPAELCRAYPLAAALVLGAGAAAAGAQLSAGAAVVVVHEEGASGSKGPGAVSVANGPSSKGAGSFDARGPSTPKDERE